MHLVDIVEPTAAWFQPVRNFATMADWGVTVLFGPEVENASGMTPGALLLAEQTWMDEARKLGLAVVIKNAWKFPTLPDNVVGFLHSVDEPNAKGIPAASLTAEFNRLRALNPDMPIS